MAKVLIFGASGQTGHYLGRQWSDEGHEVARCSRSGETPADIGNFAEVEALVQRIRPDFVFHLAARSSTRHEALFDNHEAISAGTLHVLEAVHRHAPEARVFITGSGLQFVNQGRGISEKDPFAALDIYSAARIGSVYLARYYRDVLKRAVYVGYLFHHESPLRPPHHLSQKIVHGAIAISRGQAQELPVGDLSVRKEWSFAGDIAAGITTLVRQDAVFESVIGSGLPYSVQDWIEVCFSVLDLPWQKHVTKIEGFQPEYNVLYSDPATIRGLGWKPKVDFAALARMMVEAALKESGD